MYTFFLGNLLSSQKMVKLLHLQGIRGVAICSVIAFHYFPDYFPNAELFLKDRKLFPDGASQFLQHVFVGHIDVRDSVQFISYSNYSQ